MKNSIRVGFLALALVALPAFGTQVYECVSGTRFLRIHRSENGKLTGYLKSFHSGSSSGYVTGRYTCQGTRRPLHYVCRRGDYIVTARVAAGGGQVVDVELAGDFWPDSGYLYQIPCGR